MKYGIGLGSNLGNRLQNLHHALQATGKLHQGEIPLLSSPVYLTQAVDCKEGTPPFYNMAIELECDLAAPVLLARLREIELDLGRPTLRQRNASRRIDLDILYAGDLVMDSENLTLPHPRFHRRRFVLQPLADIRPELILPGQKRDVATLLAELGSDEAPLRQISTPLLPAPPEPVC